MKKILILLLFCGFWANAQQYHDKGAKFENAIDVGDTITINTRVPIFDEFGLINYYVDVSDLLALNPAPVLEWGNITGTLSDQTDLQGALNDKADQSALTAHTSNGSIHFTQSAISITESQVSDLKDYLRGDVNDTNGSNKLTLGSLEVVGQTTLQNGLNLTSIPVGTSDNILTLNQSTGDVEQRVFSLGDIDIANEAGVSQFPIGLGDQLRIQGSGDTSISFDGITNTINIHSTPGSGGGGAVTSFNGRDGAVVSQAGDYSTAMVNENTNLYFTEARVRGTDLTGLTVTNTPISSTNTFIQALGRLQGQINDREVSFSKNTAFNKNFGTSAGTVAQGNDSRINNGQTAYSWGNHASAGYVPNTRTINIGGVFKDLTADRGWSLSEIGAEPAFSKNTAFNKNFGTASGTVAEGNDSRINNGQTAYSWGNHASAGYVPNTRTINIGGVFKDLTADRGWSLSEIGATPNTRTISTGLHLSGGGNLSANRTLVVTPTVDQWIVDSEGNQRMQFHSTSNGGVILRSSAAGGLLQYRDMNNNTRFSVDNSGNVTAQGDANFNGTVTATGDVIANSDKRLKKNIKRIDNALAIVQLLGGYEYDRKDIDLHQAGVLAQEVEEVFPIAVSTADDERKTKSVAYNQLIALLIEAIKEQQIEIEQLKTLINEK